MYNLIIGIQQYHQILKITHVVPVIDDDFFKHICKLMTRFTMCRCFLGA